MGLYQSHLTAHYGVLHCQPPRVKFDHPYPANSHHSPYKHAQIVYSAKIQYAAGPDDSPHLNTAGQGGEAVC